jgi:hypothetical protein
MSTDYSKYKTLKEGFDTFTKVKFKILNHDDHLIKACSFNKEIIYLEVGTNSKNNTPDFPLSHFYALEAKKFGFKIPCDYEGPIEGYPNLTCDPLELKEVEILKEVHAVGMERKTVRFSCPNCLKNWIIEEEFDSMRGLKRTCSTLI